MSLWNVWPCLWKNTSCNNDQCNQSMHWNSTVNFKMEIRTYHQNSIVLFEKKVLWTSVCPFTWKNIFQKKNYPLDWKKLSSFFVKREIFSLVPSMVFNIEICNISFPSFWNWKFICATIILIEPKSFKEQKKVKQFWNKFFFFFFKAHFDFLTKIKDPLVC